MFSFIDNQSIKSYALLYPARVKLSIYRTITW